MNTTEFVNSTVNPTIIDRYDVPAREARLAKPPAAFMTPAVRKFIRARTGGMKLYRHQALALAQIANDNNVVVATATASGKSLSYQVAIIRELERGDGTAVVFEPTRALAYDQFEKMREAVCLAGLDPDLVGIIDGDVSMHERERILSACRAIIFTPDVFHCYFMRLLGSPSVETFLARLCILTLDEAHMMEAVFGTKSALLLRRLRAAHNRLRRKHAVRNLLVIAATATIRDPGGHLRALTGLEFEVVGDEHNGAPFRGLSVQQVEGPSSGAAAEKAAADILHLLAAAMPDGQSFIAFADSRQGVERITRLVDRTSVVPYRSGYMASDRRGVEKALRTGSLKGVVSTSALELGIDIPQFTVGLTVGIPPTRKSLRQRVGRTGRASEGTFLVMAPPSAFAMLGSSLREHFLGEVEPSPLYLDNRFILFEQACCYRDEAGIEDGEVSLDETIDWPSEFHVALGYSLPGARRPRELDALASRGLNSPQLAFPLRSLSQASYSLVLSRSNEKIGDIDDDKALRETYPGATYLHLGQPYRAKEWRVHSNRPTIYLERTSRGETTHPLMSIRAAASLAPEDILEQHLLESDVGVLAETQIRISQSVEGYRIGSSKMLYADLRHEDPRMCRKRREFSTTGVIIRIREPWFEGQGELQISNRRALGEALLTLLTSVHGLLPSDVHMVCSGIALDMPSGPTKVDDAIVVYDDVPGGARLCSPIFRNMKHLLDRLQRAAAVTGQDALISEVLVQRAVEWFVTLQATAPASTAATAADDGSYLVYASGSEVSARSGGIIVERTVIAPAIVDMPQGPMLMYQYESQPGVLAMVPADQIEPVGHEWRQQYWHPLTGEIREIAA